MLRKIISVIMFSLPVSCLAWTSGFYAGAGVGADAVDYYQKAYIKQSPAQQKFSVINITDGAAQGLFGSLFGGYDFVRGRLYVAGEANVNASTAKFKTSNIEYDHSTKQIANTQFKLLPTWGASLLPGFLYDETTLFYGRAGYAGAEFVVKTTDVSLANKHQVLSGLRYGLGIEKRICNRVGVRFEYNHFIYQGSTIFHIDTSNGAVTPKQTRIYTETNQFEFGLVYRFA